MSTQVAFRRLFYGLMLALIDFRLQTLDILPDFIGYILVFSALSNLKEVQPHFGKAKLFAFVLIFTSLPDLLQQPNNQGGINFFDYSIPLMVFTALAGIIRIFMVYYICEGIQDLVIQQNEALALKAKVRAKAYIWVHYLWLLITPFSLNVPEHALPIWILFLIPIFIVEIMFIALVHRVGGEVSGLE